jgi:hypothetical protein
MSQLVARTALAKVVLSCALLVGLATTAHASTHRRFTFILDFNTCVPDPDDPSIIRCVEKDSTGKAIGQIKVTFQSFIATDGTCDINPNCAMSWHEGYLYTLDTGTMTVASATAWQEQARETDETGGAPLLGFSVGAITGATGKYSGTTGTLTMRWDGNVCICLFDVIQAS